MEPIRPAPIHVAPTTDRKAERTGFENALRGAAQGAASGIAQTFTLAAPFVPGGAVIAGAVRGAVASPSSALGPTTGGHGAPSTTTGGSVGAPGADGVAGLPMDGSSSEAMALLQLQIAVQRENREFTTISNVAKARHDTAKAAIQNIHG